MRTSKQWIVLPLVLLLGCASLTPDRIAVLAAIAGQAATLGASEWLAKHPEHRQLFLNALTELGNVLRANQNNPQALEDAAVEFMNKLPTSTFRGKDGELYVTGDGKDRRAELVVWDDALNKGVAVRDVAVEPVVRQVYSGLKRACAPTPPMPMPAQTKARVLRRYVVVETNLPPAPFPGETVIIPEGPEAPAKSDAQLDAEFEAIKKKLKKNP